MASRRRPEGNRRRGKKSLTAWSALCGMESLVWCVLLGVSALGFYRFLQTSSEFSVKKVEIAGTRHLDPRQVLKQTGITEGDNLFFLDVNAAEDAVESMPYVRSCSLDRAFPDTVMLTIEEREPMGTLMVNSRAFEIDSEGVVLREYGVTELPKEPYLTNVGDIEFVEVGATLESAAFASAMQVWEAFSEQSISRELRLSEFSLAHKDDMRMYFEELPYEVRWGRGDYAQQAKRLELLWRSQQGQLPCKEYLDLRWERDLACK